MAGKAKEKTATQKKADAARAAHAVAVGKNAPNAGELRKVMEAAILAENTERFKTLAGVRVDSAINKIMAFGKTSNKRSYEYTPAQVSKAFEAIENALKSARATFDRAMSGTSESKSTSGFTFD